jgi:hypothetical protein
MKQIDIIVYKDEDTDKETSWGIVFEDGSVKWYDSIEEATYYWDITEGLKS